MKGRKLISYFSFILIVLLAACKKDSADRTKPLIDVILPHSGSNYNMFDTIAISLHLSDETKLQRIEITLKDATGNIAQAGFTVDLSGTQYTLNTELPIVEYRLPSGNYSIDFSLTDGVNSAQKSIPIYITESPTYKTGFLFVSKSASQHLFTKKDTSFATISTINQSGAYVASAQSNYYQLLYAASGINQNFKAYNLNNNIVKWSLANSSTGATITSCVSDDKNAYIGKNDGNVYKFNSEGTFVRSFNSNESSFYVKHVFACNNYVVANLFDFTSNAKKTVVYDNSTGIIKNVFYNREIKAAYQKSANELYIISNDQAGQGLVEVLTLPGGNLYQSVSLGNYEIYDACLIDSNTLLISNTEGKIYYYQFSNSNSIPVLTTVQAKQMKYSEKFNELYVASDKYFYVYQVTPFSLSPKTSFLSNDTIADFHVLFNK